MKFRNDLILALMVLPLLPFSCSREKSTPIINAPFPREINTSVLAMERIERVKNAKPDDVRIALLGNSITEMGGNWNPKLGRSDVINCGQGGYTTQQFTWLLDSTLFSATPEYCFIMGGINDLSLGVPLDRIFHNYQFLIRNIREHEIKVVIQSTLYQSNNSTNNPFVEELNSRLKAHCRELGIPFIDLNKKMSGKSGLREDLTTDGTHLNEEGYGVWSGILKKWMEKNL